MRAVKIALYGLLVSGPLSHVLVGKLQKAFAGKTGRASKLGQIFASNLIISPIQAFCELASFFFSFCSLNAVNSSSFFSFFQVYLFSLSVINGAKSWNDVKTALVDSFFPVMKVRFFSFLSCLCVSGFDFLSFRLFLSRTIGRVAEHPTVYIFRSEFPLA